MQGSFFTRASILSTVDHFIASSRGDDREKRSITKEIEQEILQKLPENSVFIEMYYQGIDLIVLNRIYEMYLSFEFHKTPSVIQKIDWYAKTGESTYDILKQITLFDHSVHVAEYALDDTLVDKDQRALIALFGLLHDIGKSKKLCEFYDVDEVDHESASAELIRFLLDETPYKRLGEIFSKELLALSSVKKKSHFSAFGFYIESLHRADIAAREMEVQMIQEKLEGKK